VESAKPETKTVETKPTISEEKQTPLPQEHKEAPPTTPPQKEKPTEPPKKESQKPKASIVTGSITAPPIAKIGDDIIVKISLDYILEITTINLSLSFEPELMQLKEVREGELLEVSPNTSMSSSLNLIDKTLSIQIATDFENAGITGQGVLLYLQFSAVGSGTVQLSIPTSQFVNKYNETLPGQFAVTSLVIQE